MQDKLSGKNELSSSQIVESSSKFQNSNFKFINVGLIGHPIEHSLSPQLHNEFFRLCGINGSYSLWDTPDSRMLASFVDKARNKGIHGFNVTIPHKLSIISYLDELDELAERIGSVNTVVNFDGLLKGYNTDVSGVEYLLKNNSIDINNKPVALIGCGGAARAAAVVLAEQGCTVFCIVRDLNSINAAQMQSIYDRIYLVQEKACSQAISDCKIIVNALPPQAAEQFVLQNATIIKRLNFLAAIDLNYYPPFTDFMKRFRNPARIVGGVDMLIGQAAKAFNLWSGCKLKLPKKFTVDQCK
ncbi:MAG: shikimate dehydrogenase [Negativicutes bacterium]|jgi:shikimate dehydrogenase